MSDFERWQRAMSELYLRADRPTSRSMGKAADMSPTSALEIARGRRLSRWPAVAHVIRILGGNPDDYRTLWGLAKSEQPVDDTIRRNDHGSGQAPEDQGQAALQARAG